LNPIFRSKKASVMKVIHGMSPHLMNPEDKIISYGDTGTHFYLIANGDVEVQLPDKKNDPILLKTGDYFGEIALLYDCKR